MNAARDVAHLGKLFHEQTFAFFFVLPGGIGLLRFPHPALPITRATPAPFTAAFPATAPTPLPESRPARAPPAWERMARAAVSNGSAPATNTRAPGWPRLPVRPRGRASLRECDAPERAGAPPPQCRSRRGKGSTEFLFDGTVQS